MRSNKLVTFNPLTSIIILLVSLMVLRHVILVYAPSLVVSAYLYMFIITYIITYIITHNNNVSTFVALIIVYGRMIYRYTMPSSTVRNKTGITNTLMFVIGIMFTLVLAIALKPYSSSIYFRAALYVMIIYIISSLLEWDIHKYIMHCYAYWPW
jgi:hypothetical protein